MDSSPCHPRPHEAGTHARGTLILTRSDIAALTTPQDDLAAAREAFLSLFENRAVSPSPLHLKGEGGNLHAKGATLRTDDGRIFAAVKVNANFPENRQRHGLPTIQGAVLLYDAENGRLLAILDSIEVTLRRTAAATALAASHLARPDAKTIAIIGCGALAMPHLSALLGATPARYVRLYDGDRHAAAMAADEAARAFAIKVSAEHEIASATRDAEIVVTCTTARKAFLDVKHVAPGTFIAGVGADAPEKSELTPALMAGAKIVADSRAQASAMGDLHHAIKAGKLSEKDVYASLDEIVSGKVRGRISPRDIIIFDSTGLGVQDVASCAAIYEKALVRRAGTPVQLGGQRAWA